MARLLRSRRRRPWELRGSILLGVLNRQQCGVPKRSRVTLNPGLPVPSSGDVARTTASGMIANFHDARVSPSLMITGWSRRPGQGWTAG